MVLLHVPQFNHGICSKTVNSLHQKTWLLHSYFNAWLIFVRDLIYVGYSFPHSLVFIPLKM